MYPGHRYNQGQVSCLFISIVAENELISSNFVSAPSYPMKPFITHSRPRRYGPIQSGSTCVYWILNALIARYVKAVIRSYIEVKQARGRTGQQIGWKLLLLEREVSRRCYVVLIT
jgi:hypothetical protein